MLDWQSYRVSRSTTTTTFYTTLCTIHNFIGTCITMLSPYNHTAIVFIRTLSWICDSKYIIHNTTTNKSSSIFISSVTTATTVDNGRNHHTKSRHWQSKWYRYLKQRQQQSKWISIIDRCIIKWEIDHFANHCPIWYGATITWYRYDTHFESEHHRRQWEYHDCQTNSNGYHYYLQLSIAIWIETYNIQNIRWWYRRTDATTSYVTIPTFSFGQYHSNTI